MNYNNLTDLEDRALGAFNGDTSEALDVKALVDNWPFTAENSVGDTLSGMIGRGLIQKTDNKYFLTQKGLQLWNQRNNQESQPPPSRRHNEGMSAGAGLVTGLVVGTVVGDALASKK